MVSKHKICANKENARASTGPRTQAGKLRSAHNALRHGLSLSALDDPDLAPVVKPLARKIAGAGTSPELVELARLIVAAQLDLVRVRKTRRQMLSRSFSADSGDIPLDIGVRTLDAESLATYAGIFAGLTPRLMALDRYEQRALSRRKFAIRRFDAECDSTTPNCTKNPSRTVRIKGRFST